MRSAPNQGLRRIWRRILQHEKCKMQKLNWKRDGGGGMWVGHGLATSGQPSLVNCLAFAVALNRAIWIAGQPFVVGASKVVACQILPPSAIRLPLPAKTCHGLPRTVNLGPAIAATSGRMPEASLVQGREASFERSASCGVDGRRSGATTNWFDGRENQGRTHPRPVTVCHIAEEQASKETLCFMV